MARSGDDRLAADQPVLGDQPLTITRELGRVHNLVRRFKQSLFQPQMRRGRARAHPHLAPNAPVDDLHRTLAAEREGIEKCIGRRIVHLTRGRENGTDGGKKNEALQRLIAQRLFQNQRSTHLGIKHPGRAFGALQHQRSVVQNARGVKDSVDLSITPPSLGNNAAHLFEIRNVSLRNHQSARERTDLNQLANGLLDGFGLPGVVERSLPLRLVG